MGEVVDIHVGNFNMKLTMVSPDSRLGTVGIYIQYIYITKIVVLFSEPVRGRSRATELPCL